jgi:hypothetical protein
LWPSQIKKLVELVARAERSNQPSTTALQTTDRQTDTIEIPPTEILDRIFTGTRRGPFWFCALPKLLPLDGHGFVSASKRQKSVPGC